jgi:hypothetical protein
MTDISSWSEVILKGIVPVATGSIITLFGVWLQSRSEASRLKRQLKHDAEQREKERQMDLRREVFLGAAETLGKQSEYLNLFSKVDFDFWKDQEVLRGCIGAANKVHLIAGSETIEAYVRASQSWAKAILQLSKSRLKIEEVKTELKMEEDLIAMLSTHRDETLSSIKAQGTSGIQSQELHELHQKRFQDLQRQIEDSFGKKGKLHSKLARLLMQISVEGVAAHVEFSEKLVAVNLAARREVDLRIDENRYREFQALTAKEVQVSSDAFVEEIHGWINAQEQKLDS